jgi:hypothetical protein
MFEDGTCQQINKLNKSGWSTLEEDDWIYYPQQYGKLIYIASDMDI